MSMNQKRLYERVASKVAEDILSGAHLVGDRLASERELAIKFNVSRPTIREAMIALEVDGLVDVVTGSGVYVKSLSRKGDTPSRADVGAFELLEARALVEGEAAALAARFITDETLSALEALVQEMTDENERDVKMSEDADRRFHMTIADASNNSAMLMVVESLWDARVRSKQAASLMAKSRAEGVKPRINEHKAILQALQERDPDKARAAMRTHLRGVADKVFDVTEAEALDKVRSELAQEREQFFSRGR